MTNPIGVGILGCGFIARAHMRGYMAFPTETRITALYNRTRAKAEAARDYIHSYAADQADKLAEHLKNLNPADDLVELRARREALLELANSDIAIYDQWQALATDDRVSLVTNTTPPYLHHASSRDMLQAGKHVLLEKPLSGSLAEADDLIAIAEANQLCPRDDMLMTSAGCVNWWSTTSWDESFWSSATLTGIGITATTRWSGAVMGPTNVAGLCSTTAGICSTRAYSLSARGSKAFPPG